MILILIVLPSIFFIRNRFIARRLDDQVRLKIAALKGLIEKLDAGRDPEELEVRRLAEDPSLRIILFHILEAYASSRLFPQDLYTEEKGAEGYMVNWLEFPTELGRPPNEITLLDIIAVEVKVHYYVFCFFSDLPRWAHKLKWMLGVCGPYDHNSKPFDAPGKVFSRFRKFGSDPAAEVQWVHESINQS